MRSLLRSIPTDADGGRAHVLEDILDELAKLVAPVAFARKAAVRKGHEH